MPVQLATHARSQLGEVRVKTTSVNKVQRLAKFRQNYIALCLNFKLERDPKKQEKAQLFISNFEHSLVTASLRKYV